jgi:hypothetical protein
MLYGTVTFGYVVLRSPKMTVENSAFSKFFELLVSSPLPFIVTTHYLRIQQPLHVPFGDVSVPMKSAVMAGVSSRSVKKNQEIWHYRRVMRPPPGQSGTNSRYG